VPAAGAPLTATRTVSVAEVCAPARGERIDSFVVGALTGLAAVVAWVCRGGRAATEALPPPQPLAARIDATARQGGPALNAALTLRLSPVVRPRWLVGREPI
jgi:hypothetical protein